MRVKLGLGGGFCSFIFMVNYFDTSLRVETLYIMLAEAKHLFVSVKSTKSLVF